jgi:hypothetical protein
MTTTREKLFAKAESRTKEVTLTTGDVVVVKGLKLTARTKLVKLCTVDDQVDTEQLVPHTVIACTFDQATGEPLFTLGDYDTIADMPATEIDPMWEAAAELNGFTAEAAKTAKNA